NKPQAQEVLKEMIARKFPITAAVFNALYTKRTNAFSEQIQSLLKQFNLSETARYGNISNQLQQMVNQPLQSKAELIKRIITEATNNNQQFFHLLKATGIIIVSRLYILEIAGRGICSAKQFKSTKYIESRCISAGTSFKDERDRSETKTRAGCGQ